MPSSPKLVHLNSVEVKFQLLITQLKHMDLTLYFLDHLCSFWTLGRMNTVITLQENLLTCTLKKDQRSSLH